MTRYNIINALHKLLICIAGEVCVLLGGCGDSRPSMLTAEYGDYSFARDFKHYTVAELRAFGFELRMAVEDDPRNKVMFDDEGIPCVYIHSGYH